VHMHVDNHCKRVSLRRLALKHTLAVAVHMGAAWPSDKPYA